MERVLIYLEDEEFAIVSDTANELHLSVSEYIAQQLFPRRERRIVSLISTIDRALELNSGSEFTIPELFTYDEYSGISRGMAGTIGREFHKRVLGDLSNDFLELGRRNRQTIYRRL